MGCYGETRGAGPCQSGVTYKLGFRDARATLDACICLYENVRDVMHCKTDSSGVKRQPEVKTVVEDAETVGGKFGFAQVDTSKFLLPQRRNRVYGVLSMNEQRGDRLKTEFKEVMSLLETHARWPIEDFLQEGANGQPPVQLTKRLKAIVDKAVDEVKGLPDADLFLDASTSADRNSEKALGMATCLRPSHKVYSVVWLQIKCLLSVGTYDMHVGQELRVIETSTHPLVHIRTNVHTYICTYIIKTYYICKT